MHQVQLGPHFSDKPLNQNPNRLEEHQKTLDQRDKPTEGQDELEPGRPASLRPAGLARGCVGPKQLTPTPGEDQRRPGEGGGHVATILGRPASPGRPAPLCSVSHPGFVWKTSAPTLAAYN